MAASLLIALVTGSLYVVNLSRGHGARDERRGRAATPRPANSSNPLRHELDQAAAHYEKAIAGLEQVANASDSPLDPELMATLKANLGVIDQAINESRTALERSRRISWRRKASSRRSAARSRCCRTRSR